MMGFVKHFGAMATLFLLATFCASAQDFVQSYNFPNVKTGGPIGQSFTKNGLILYVSTTGNDSNSGKTWDTAKLTIMAAVCALPTGNCSTSPKQAGTGTVYFQSGVSCNSNTNSGCWIAGFGDSQYPNMTSSTEGPTAWTVETSPRALSFICAANEVSTSVVNQPFCTVVGPFHTVGIGNLPLVWVSGNSLGAFYINGMSGSDGTNFTAAWGRIGIDSATGQISATPTVTQTVSFTIENVTTTNFPGGSWSVGPGPQLALGNGFWMHIHDSGFTENGGEMCQVSSISRTSNVTTVTTTGCGASASNCPFLNGDHLSIRSTTGDNSFNGTFTATSACSSNTVTFSQTGPNFSGSVGSAGIIGDDRSFGIVCYSCQVEMARMHTTGGIKFYSGSSSNLQLNDDYIEGNGTLANPILWISPGIYGGGGVIELSALLMSDTGTLPSVINDTPALPSNPGSGPQIFLHNEFSQSTYPVGPSIVLGGADATTRTTGLLANGGSGWTNNQYFEAETDIGRRQAAIAANIFTNLAPQNPASWTLGGATTSSGKHDPLGGTGAIEIDATSSLQPFFYSVGQAVSVGDTWYFGGWVRAASGFEVANNPFIFYIGSGNQCYGNASQPLNVYTPFAGDGNWFWVTGACQVWATAGSSTVSFGVALNASTPVQVYRPFVFKVPSGTYTTTEVADEINSLGFGPSTQAGAGDLVYPADKKLCMSSGSATNEYCAYLAHSNTANRTYRLPDATGNVTLSIFSTQSAATNTNITATNMVAFTSAIHSYLFTWTVSLTAVGVGCSGSTTVTLNAIFTDPNASTSTTQSLGTITLANTGNGMVGFVANGTDSILAKSGTAVQYSTSSYTAGSGCTTNPTYQVSPTLVQLW